MAYSGAPYNFVALSKKIPEVAKSVTDLPAHNEIKDELLSGRINVKMTALTDIFVGGWNRDGNTEQFAVNSFGQTVIPGSTVKGLLRNNMQILGFSSVAKDVEDYAIMYRKVASKGTKLTRTYRDGILGVKTISVENGRQVSLPTNVEAGYITCENGSYYIYSAGKPINEATYGRINYFSISEYKMLQDEKSFDIDKSKTQYIMKPGRPGSKPSFEPQVNYAPYIEKVLFKPNGKSVSAVTRKVDRQDSYPNYRLGYLVSTGFMNNKKVVYVVPVPSGEPDRIKLSEGDVKAFKRDYEGRKNSLHGTKCKDEKKKEDAKKFYDLPVPGETKPVFFMRYEGRTYFGFTPYARVFYKNSLYSGIPEEHKVPGRIDYATSILGYSNDDNKETFKSRVSIEDAVMVDDKGKRSVVLTLGDPKLSSCLDYVVQDNELGNSYNDDFSLRGIKQYWLHEKIADNKNHGNNANVDTVFEAKKAGCSFETTIHFKNLRKAELGLLLLCIYPGEDYQFNVGRAKAYGFGRLCIAKPEIFLLDYSRMYSSLGLDVFCAGSDISEYIEEYKKEIFEIHGLKLDMVDDFFMMKDKTKIPKEENIRFMDLKEYQKREEALPTVEQVLSGQKGQMIEKAPSKGSGANAGNKHNFGGGGRTRGKGGQNYRGANKGYGGKDRKPVTSSSSDDKNIKKLTGEFVRFDKGSSTVVFKVEGVPGEMKGKADGFKALLYTNMKPGEKVAVEKLGNRYFLAERQ